MLPLARPKRSGVTLSVRPRQATVASQCRVGAAHLEGQVAGSEKTPANKALPPPGFLSLDGREWR